MPKDLQICGNETVEDVRLASCIFAINDDYS